MLTNDEMRAKYDRGEDPLAQDGGGGGVCVCVSVCVSVCLSLCFCATRPFGTDGGGGGGGQKSEKNLKSPIF